MIYFTLFFEFFKIGLFCFGGGFGMIPLIEETVLQYGWLTESEFYNFIGVCESTPGPIAVNMATYVGSECAGMPGSIAATAGVILPSFVIILLIASVLTNLTNNKYFSAFLRGVQPVIIALILSTGIILLLKAFGCLSPAEFHLNIPSVVIFNLLVVVYFGFEWLFGKKVSAVRLILLSAGLGIGVSVLADLISL